MLGQRNNKSAIGPLRHRHFVLIKLWSHAKMWSLILNLGKGLAAVEAQRRVY